MAGDAVTGSRWVSVLLAALLGMARPAAALDLDTPPPPAPRVDLGLPQAGAVAPARRAAARGNPLWAIPLSALFATRERPIFSPSRRPPPAAEDAAPAGATDAAPAEAGSASPNLTLVGTIAGPDEGFGIFLKGDSQDVLRLKTGEAHDGWVLQSVKAREATLTNGEATVTLPLSPPEGEGAAGHVEVTRSGSGEAAGSAEGSGAATPDDGGDSGDSAAAPNGEAPPSGENGDAGEATSAPDGADMGTGETNDTSQPDGTDPARAGEDAAHGTAGTPVRTDTTEPTDGEASDSMRPGN